MANNELIRGSTTMLILNLINEKDMYGYEMIQELEDRSENIFSLKTGTLYPLLHKLEGKNLLESYKKTADTGRERKYYKITKDGKSALIEEKKEWKSYISAINSIMEAGVQYE